ncbi:IS4 family transposase [Clostridium lundense]|uniref:IS4 family transposase n=1 Tax=Clostridium lundense TaxID=319475 RepID=UPI00047F9523|nr:IS4 family transposase [Clostridium lundense]
MSNSYVSRFKKMFNSINSDTMKTYAHLDKQNSFTRKRKMPLADIILCTLSKKGLTTSMELHQYFTQKGEYHMSISKQGYLQQRKKLNYEVFSFLNKEYLQNFYYSTEPILWNKYLVFAIDGSKAEVPNSDENRVFFGECGNNHNKGEVRALVSSIFDVFNHFFLDLQIDSIKTSESELAKKNIYAIRKIIPDTNFIVIFDRGYPSIELIHFLEENGVQYLFRLSSNDYKNERKLMITEDETVRLVHTNPRLTKIKKNHPEIVEELRAKKYTSTRIILSKLPSGSELALMTNLPIEFRGKEIENLYFKRWEIEKKYHTLKNKMKLESVTGKATLYVYQDFWSQIVVYNMIQDVLHSSNKNIEKEINKHKYPIRVNENIAIGLFKEKFIKLLIEPNDKLREKKLIQLQRAIEKYIVPIRNLKSQDRKHNFSNKYQNNQKNSL